MTKKKYKIVESDLFKQQKKELPEEIKKKLNKALKSLSENPIKAPHSMSLFGKPNAKELKQWASDINVNDIDIILEYLFDKECLNKSGKELTHQFWEEYIKDNEEIKELERELNFDSLSDKKKIK